VSFQQPRVDLRRPRDVGELLTDGFGTYFRNFGTFVGIAAAVVAPVQLIVSGIGLRQLWVDFDPTPSVAQVLLPAGVNVLMVTPLVTAMTIYVLLDLGDGRAPSAGNAIQRGLDVFTPLLLAVVMAGVGIAAGFLALIVPGVFLAIRWYFVPQAVVVEGRRGSEALSRSWELVRGSSWRVFGIVVMVSLAIGAATAAIQLPLVEVARAADSALPDLIGLILAQTLAVPAGAVVAALLYFDLRSQREGAQAPGGGPVSPPPTS
jgi:hypothetical protein